MSPCPQNPNFHLNFELIIQKILDSRTKKSKLGQLTPCFWGWSEKLNRNFKFCIGNYTGLILNSFLFIFQVLFSHTKLDTNFANLNSVTNGTNHQIFTKMNNEAIDKNVISNLDLPRTEIYQYIDWRIFHYI